MTIEVWPLSRIRPYERNARKIPQSAIDKVATSLREFGWQQPIVVDLEGVIVAGHTRWLAAKQLGWQDAPVHIASELSPAQIRAYRLMDNRSHDESKWDLDILGVEMSELRGFKFDLSLTGFSLGEVAKIAPMQGLTDPDDVPELPEEPVTKPGDLWLLGCHRVLCGDATSMTDVERLLVGAVSALCLTDPPYGIGIVKVKGGSDKGVVGGGKPYGSSEGIVGGGGSVGAMYPYGGAKKGVGGGANIVRPKLYAPVVNDDSTDTAEQFYRASISARVDQFVIFGGNYFTTFLPPSSCWIVWDKQNSGNFADVEMAWTSFDRGAKLYKWTWNGLSRQGERKTELATRVHPTQKPVGLFVQILNDFEGDPVYDPFLGSGSTLIAAEKTGRGCYGMEIVPAYVDVIVKRWENFTGKKATLQPAEVAA